MTRIPLNQIRFLKNKFGKPFLKNNHNVHFNVSHSGKWVVAAIDTFSVGVDIEQIKEIDFKTVEHIFSRCEYNKLINMENVNRLEYFYEIWTMKESYIKALGMGLSIPLNSFCVYINHDIFSVKADNCQKKCFIRQYEIDYEYKMAVCSLNKELPTKIKVFDEDTFYDSVLLRGVI